MPTTIKGPQQREYTIPKELRELFLKEWRVIGPWPPAPGYWPIDVRVLLEGGLLERLARNREFTDQYRIVIMPKPMIER